MKTQINEKGFTLLEAIIAISIVSILIASAGFSLSGRSASAQLKSAAADLTGHLNLARISAVRDTRPWAVVFEAASNSYRLLSNSGEDFAPEDPADPVDWSDGDETLYRTVTLAKGISFNSEHGSYDGNPVDDGITHSDNRIIFNPNGTCSANGTIYLSTAGGKTYVITTHYATGQIRIHSNDGSGWSY